MIVNPEGCKYEIMERLGQGTFGQVLKCYNAARKSVIAVKIIKNKSAYYHQALVEVRILQMLNNDFDAGDEKKIVPMLDFFVYRKHLCIASSS
jgi:dual specificity protein kinase YAK1